MATLPGVVWRAARLLFAALYIATVVVAENACSVLGFGPPCRGPEGDGWMLPFFLAPLGIPAVVSALLFIAGRIWPESTILPRIAMGARLLFLAMIGLAVVLAFGAGLLARLRAP